MQITEAEVAKITEVVTDPSFRLLGFSMNDLRELRRILDMAGIRDLKTLAQRLGHPH